MAPGFEGLVQWFSFIATVPFPKNLAIITLTIAMFGGPLTILALIIWFVVWRMRSEWEKTHYTRRELANFARNNHSVQAGMTETGKVIYPKDTQPNWTPEAVNAMFQNNEKRSYDRYTEELQCDQEREREREENAMNGRVNWHPVGKRYSPNPHALDRIWGMEGVIEEIEKSITNLLLNPKLVAEYDVSMNAGLLLYGPPGTGKTELARAVAEHLGLYFMAVKPSDLMGTLVGATEQNIASMFDEAKQHAPSILFIDEIDSIGKQRGNSHMYHDSELTQLLSELDGFEKREGVFVLAATNRIEALDDALLRDGRFGTQIEVPAPDQKTLWNMFAYWASPLHLAEDVYAVEVGIALEGQTGATVKGLVERLKHIEINKRVNGQKAIIIREEVLGEIDRILRKKQRA